VPLAAGNEIGVRRRQTEGRISELLGVRRDWNPRRFAHHRRGPAGCQRSLAARARAHV